MLLNGVSKTGAAKRRVENRHSRRKGRSGSLSLVAGRRRAWLSRITWMNVDNGSKHSIYEETNRWIPQSLGIRGPHIAQCQALISDGLT